MDFNVLKWIYILFALIILVIGGFCNFLEERLPPIILKSFYFGKFAYQGKTAAIIIEVPKSWFRYIYVTAVITSLTASFYAVEVYFFQADVPLYLLDILDFLCGSSRKTFIDPLSVLIGLTLFILQSFKRFYVTWFVSIFSDGKMNLAHFIMAQIHYFAIGAIFLAEAQGFGRGQGLLSRQTWSQFSLFQVLTVIVFLYAWSKQFECSVILANLRKNSKGKVVSKAHIIPRGGLFDLLSTPHFTCEIVMYLAWSSIFWQSSTFHYVTLFVIINQIECSLLNHWWYKKNFKTYPKERKALIPYVL